MSSDIRDILTRLDHIGEGALTPTGEKHGLNPQQKSVDQLPALFKPRSIRALTAKKDPQHPMAGKFVGDSVEPKLCPGRSHGRNRRRHVEQGQA